MSRLPTRPVLPGFALGSLVLLLAACSGDSFPSQPGSSPSAEPAGTPAADYVANSWANKPDMPTARRGLVTASVNGIIYAIGGRSANEVNLRTVEAFNTTGTSLVVWTPKAPLPAPRAWPSGAATLNGKIYVPGGLDADYNSTKTLYMYKPATNKWVKKAAMPVASFGGAAVAIGGKLYVLTPTPSSTLLHRYDPSTNSWTPRASGPLGHYHPVAGVIDGKLYVAGTSNADESSSATLSVYDPPTNTWLTSKAPMPQEQMGAGGVAIGGKLYAVGGFEGPGAISMLQMYNPATNAWVEKAHLNGARGYVGAAAANGVLYAMGGLGGSNVLKTNQAYYP
jgi:N-acetylneuraminic acid mutarotase